MSGIRSAVSLHSQTQHSKEAAEFLPLFVHRVPILNQWVVDEMKSYKESTGIAVDFRRVYWTPPVSPQLVLVSEKAQIEGELDLEAMVSITDHDSIAAGLSLQGESTMSPPPISVEWTDVEQWGWAAGPAERSGRRYGLARQIAGGMTRSHRECAGFL